MDQEELVFLNAIEEAAEELSRIEYLTNIDITSASAVIVEKILCKDSARFDSLLNSLDPSTRNSLLKATDLLRKWLNKNAPILNRAIVGLQRLQERIKKEEERVESLPEEETYPYQSKFLHKYQWCVGHNMTMGFLREAVFAARKSKNPGSTLNRIITRFYTENNCSEIDALIAPWGKSVVMADPKRMKIIKDCIEALRLKSKSFNPANLVVPTLIAQIDGCIHTYFLHLGFKYNKKSNLYSSPEGIKKKRDELLSETRYLVRLLERTMIPNEHIKRDEHDEKISSLIKEILFQKAYTGHPLQNWGSLNRHKILHGENVTYGRIDNVIRCLLILDYLCWLR